MVGHQTIDRPKWECDGCRRELAATPASELNEESQRKTAGPRQAQRPSLAKDRRSFFSTFQGITAKTTPTPPRRAAAGGKYKV